MTEDKNILTGGDLKSYLYRESIADKNLSYKLQKFEGPLDLLLHLIEKNKIDIFDIPISVIIEQYTYYIKQMQEEDLYIASEFIEMVSRLLYIKSRLLLPKKEEEQDPRDELVRIIMDYRKIRLIADYFSERYDIYKNRYEKLPMEIIEENPPEEKFEQTLNPLMLYEIIAEILNKRSLVPKAEKTVKALTEKKMITVSEKIISIMRKLYNIKGTDFISLLNVESAENLSKDNIVVTFVSVLELLKTKRISADSDDILSCNFVLNKIR